MKRGTKDCGAIRKYVSLSGSKHRSIEANLSNYERLLTINPEGFAIMLKKWSALSKSAQTFVGLTANKIRRIDKPLLIISGDGATHTKETDECLGQKLSNARLSPISGENVSNAKNWFDQLLPEIEGFLNEEPLSPSI